MLDCKSKSIQIESKLDLAINTHLTTCGQIKKLIGYLMYLCYTSYSIRSELCLNVWIILAISKVSKEMHWIYLKNVLKYIKGILDYSIIYRKQYDLIPVLEGFVDADCWLTIRLENL